MSVTTPIFRFDVAACEAGAEGDVAADSDAAAGCEAGGGCDAADGAGVAAVEHAATMMARLPNSDRPSERCMEYLASVSKIQQEAPIHPLLTQTSRHSRPFQRVCGGEPLRFDPTGGSTSDSTALDLCTKLL